MILNALRRKQLAPPERILLDGALSLEIMVGGGASRAFLSQVPESGQWVGTVPGRLRQSSHGGPEPIPNKMGSQAACGSRSHVKPSSHQAGA